MPHLRGTIEKVVPTLRNAIQCRPSASVVPQTPHRPTGTGVLLLIYWSSPRQTKRYNRLPGLPVQCYVQGRRWPLVKVAPSPGVRGWGWSYLLCAPGHCVVGSVVGACTGSTHSETPAGGNVHIVVSVRLMPLPLNRYKCILGSYLFESTITKIVLGE